MVPLKHKDLVDPSSCPLHSYENIKRENASCSAKASSATVDKELPRRQVRAKRLPFTVTRVLNLWPVRLVLEVISVSRWEENWCEQTSPLQPIANFLKTLSLTGVLYSPVMINNLNQPKKNPS